VELSQQLQAAISNQSGQPEVLAALMAVVAGMAPQRSAQSDPPSGAVPAAHPPALREPPPPSFPAELPTIDCAAITALARELKTDGTHWAILHGCWEVIVRNGLHTSDAMTHAITNFWHPDGSSQRDAVAAYQWGSQEAPQLTEEVSRTLAEVRSLRDSLHGASLRLASSVSRAGFLHHVMRRAVATAPQLEAMGPAP
jgi:hypothetical protein